MACSDIELVSVKNITRIGQLEEELSLKNQKLSKYDGAVDYLKGNQFFIIFIIISFVDFSDLKVNLKVFDANNIFFSYNSL